MEQWRVGSTACAFAVLALALFALAVGCTFDTAGVGPGSWGPRPRDALELVDARGDARLLPDTPGAPGDLSRRDAGRDVTALAPDALAPDTLAPDALAPDTLPRDTLAPDTQPPTCDAQFGHVPGYIFCQANAAACKFYFSANKSCTWACAQGGGTCDHAHADRDNTCVEDGGAVGCNVVQRDGICICRRQ